MQNAKLTGLFITLAVLDLVGTILLKEAGVKDSIKLYVAGALTFGALAAVVSLAVQYTELMGVQIGWIVALLLLTAVVDTLVYKSSFTPVQWSALAVACLATVTFFIASES